MSSKGGVNATDSKEKKSNGNCLILVVSNQIKSIDSDNYIVVLDYLNHKKYIYKTDLLFSWVRRPVLQLADITGDGRQEIIVSMEKPAHHVKLYDMTRVMTFLNPFMQIQRRQMLNM